MKRNLRQVVVQLLVASAAAAERTGVNATDIGALCRLLLHGPAPAGEVARLAGVTTGAATGIVDRLEGAGVVRREADGSDRRKVIVVPDRAVTERRFFPHFRSLERAAAAKFYDGFTAAELETVARFLSRLAAAAGE